MRAGQAGLILALGLRHPKVQRLRRLLGRRSSRVDDRAFVVEGSKVVAEAIAASAPIEALFVERGRFGPLDHEVVCAAVTAGLTVLDLDAGVADRVGSATSPQPVLAIVGMVDVALDALPGEGLVMVCSDVRDPGNLGTVLRSAQAAGVAGVVCAAGSVDPYNSKCVRASAGALFHIPVVVGDETMQVLDQLSARGFRCLGTAARGGVPIWAADLSGPLAVVLGNEAHGLDDQIDRRLDGTLSIPISAESESLNVGVAASVIAFEAARQREGLSR